MNLSQPEYHELVEDILSRHGLGTLLDSDLTISRLTIASGRSRTWAKRVLEEEVKAGRLIRVEVIGSDGHNTVAYRKPNKNAG